MAHSQRCLVFVVLMMGLSAQPANAGSLSSQAGTWNWWVSGQGQTAWSTNPRAYSGRTGAFAAVNRSAPATTAVPAVTSTPALSSASSNSVSAPLVAVPYNGNATMSTASTAAAAAPVVSTYTAPVSAPILTTATPSVQTSSNHVDGFINMGTGPYPADSSITTGGSQPWYNTSLVNNFFGGHPTAQQQADFSNAVLQDVKHTFALSGVNVSLTNDPSVNADHTLSVVSNTSAALLPSAIGMTQVGGNGFSFMDQEAKSSGNLNQLEWIVAHNVSHELMLAFGVGEDYDKTGNYIDAPNASFSMMTSDSATFSKAAADALNQALSSERSATGAVGAQYAQVIDPQQVPEPASIAVWTIGGLLGAAGYRRRQRNRLARGSN